MRSDWVAKQISSKKGRVEELNVRRETKLRQKLRILT